MATVLPSTDASVQQAARFLVSGELVALPTETVYGLAADATNPEAVERIFKAKNRPPTNPLIVHIDSIERMLEVTAPTDERWKTLADEFWPGPLTLILPKRSKTVPDIVTAGKQTLGVRIPDVAITRDVIRASGKPLAAPSANPSNYVSPTTAQHVENSLGDRIKYILDGGHCQRGIESTILDISAAGMARILRPGPIAKEAVEALLGEAVETVFASNPEEAAQVSPGSCGRTISQMPRCFFGRKIYRKSYQTVRRH